MRFLLLFLLMNPFRSLAQNPFYHSSEAMELRYDSKQPLIDYTIKIDSHDLSHMNVDVRLRHVASSFQLAMFVHPEYDDRFYRYVEELSVESKNGKGRIDRKEKTVWQIQIKGDEALVHYRLKLPSTERQ